jgi:hypothetical protein
MEFKRGKWNSREEFQEWKIQESGKYLNMQRNANQGDGFQVWQNQRF